MTATAGHPAFSFSTHLGTYQTSVDQVLHQMDEQRIVARIWENDHTVWKPQPTDIYNRLGWLQSPSAIKNELKRVDRFVREVRAEGYTHALLLGMGGSSLAPALFSRTYGAEHGPLNLAVLDSTDPAAVSVYTQALDPDQTLFLVSSKSGTTVETLSLFKHFYNHVAGTQQAAEVGRHFVAITDPHSNLADLATRHGFREIFLADPAIGGRYAALSHFGLVPAALIGVDIPRLLDHAEQMMHACGASEAVDVNPGARLGAILGTLAREGRDKATVLTSHALSAFGDWVEQLLAESTGKEGTGIVPIVHEPLGLPDLYGNDRLFIHLAFSSDDAQQIEEVLQRIRAAGHPMLHIHLNGPYALGGQFFLWEMATAIAGYHLGVHPFDQPNVEAAKQRTQEAITVYSNTGTLTEETPAATYDDMRLYGSLVADSPEEALRAFLAQGQPGDYVTIQAYLPPPIALPVTEQQTSELTTAMQETSEIHASLLSMCARMRDKYHLAATFGYGPRYLHSTGQLHKGDAGRGLFIQLTADALQDMPIPAETGEITPALSFGTLEAAQALGDRQALVEAGRRLIRFHLGAQVVERLHQLNQALVSPSGK